MWLTGTVRSKPVKVAKSSVAGRYSVDVLIIPDYSFQTKDRLRAAEVWCLHASGWRKSHVITSWFKLELKSSLIGQILHP